MVRLLPRPISAPAGNPARVHVIGVNSCQATSYILIKYLHHLIMLSIIFIFADFA